VTGENAISGDGNRQVCLKPIENQWDTETKAMQGKIYVVVPVFNRKRLTERLLYCLRQQTFRNFEIIVIDDGSTDGTPELIAQKFSEAHLLRGDGNLWWTGATNVGIRHALAQASTGDAILLINNDLEMNPDYLESVHRVWHRTPRALIGSVTIDIDNPQIIVDGGTILNWWTAKTTNLNAGARLSDFAKDQSLEVSVLSGRGTLIPIEVFHDVGLYNDRHYPQHGDWELPARANRAGYRLIVSYAAVVKTHPKASYGTNVADSYSLADAKKYFFDVRSHMRLRSWFFFAYDTAKNPLLFLSYLVFDLARITTHFLRRLRFQ
jgi:GT2 family glycosyltransferase